MKPQNTFITHCKQCTQPYEAQRKSSKFCSDKCRLKYNRRNVHESNVHIDLECLKATQALDRLLNLSDDELIRDAYTLQMVLERADRLKKRREKILARFFGDDLPEES